VAPLKGTDTNTIEDIYRYQAMCLLSIAGLGGLPQISLPMAKLDNLPLGISLIGLPNTDIQLLKMATSLENNRQE
jgi:amidase